MTTANHASWTVRTAFPARVTVIALHGEIDADVADELYRCVAGGLDDGADVVVDLADASLLDCACIGALVRGRHTADREGRTLVLSGPRPGVRHVLDVTGVPSFVPVFPDCWTAVSRLSDSPCRSRRGDVDAHV